jgi:hypothetical protein
MMETGGVHDSRYDEGLLRLQAYGPECLNGFTNHAPMAIECLARLGLGDEIGPFLREYEPLLGPAPPDGTPFRGDPRARLGVGSDYPSWLVTFRRELEQADVREVIARWMPLLAPGCMAAAFHGPLMTIHALRGLESNITQPRTEALARGLAYWAATFQPLPGSPCHAEDGMPLSQLLADVPVRSIPAPFGAIDAAVRARTEGDLALASLVGRPRVKERDPIAPLAAAGAEALDSHPERTIVFVHAVTGPVAFRTLARWLPPEPFERAVDFLWQAVACLFATYARRRDAVAAPEGTVDEKRLLTAALAAHDAHAIKIADAALVEFAATGDARAIHAAQRACARLQDAPG